MLLTWKAKETADAGAVMREKLIERITQQRFPLQNQSHSSQFSFKVPSRKREERTLNFQRSIFYQLNSVFRRRAD